MSQTKPLGRLLATLVFFVLYVHARGQLDDSYNDRFRPDARFGDRPNPFEYRMDGEPDEDERNFFKYENDFPPVTPFSENGDGEEPMGPPPLGEPEMADEDYNEEQEAERKDSDDEDQDYEEYEEDYPRKPRRYRGDRMRSYDDYYSPYKSSRYGRNPDRRNGYRSRYEDRYDDDDYSGSRRRDPYRRYDSDFDDKYYSRNDHRGRNDRYGSYGRDRGRDDYENEDYGRNLRGRNSRYGGYSRNEGRGRYGSDRYNEGGYEDYSRNRVDKSSGYPDRGWSTAGPKGQSLGSEDDSALKEVADRVRKLLRRLRPKESKKESEPDETVNAM